MEREVGFVVCKTKKGGHIRGKTAVGSHDAVTIPVKCPPGSKPVAIHHSHPSGSVQPSSQDIKTAREFNLPVCIRGGRKIKCYKPRRR